MLKSNKGRGLVQGQQVSCFWNLHKDVFSMESTILERGKKRKLVCMHGNEFIMTDVTFKVYEKGRQRVLNSGQKNVHAYVKGKFIGETKSATFLQEGMREAYYNPFNQATFTDKETGEVLESASVVLMVNKKVYYHA